LPFDFVFEHLLEIVLRRQRQENLLADHLLLRQAKINRIARDLAKPMSQSVLA
jgi:hypothetical protein